MKLEKEHPRIHFCTGPHRRRAVDVVRLAGISRRPRTIDEFRTAQNEKVQASSFEAAGALWTRPHHTRTRPDLAGVTVITGDAETRATLNGTEGKNYAAFCYTPTGLRDGDAVT